MRIFTILTTTEPEPLARFVETCVACKATGVSIFTRPAMVMPTLPPGTLSEQDLQAKEANAAAAKNYALAANLQQEIQALKASQSDRLRSGAQWIEEIVQPIKNITQLVVMGNLHYPPTEPFTAAGFFAKIETISHALLTMGIGGVVQQTPLLQRTYIPIIGATPIATSLVPTVIDSTVTDAKTNRHPSIPAELSDKEAQYASLRLGLDRGGARRSRNEAGNSLGWSPNIAAKMENAVAAKWTTFLVRVNENTVAV